MSRLSWSTCGSPLSHHSVNKFDECIGRDPTDNRQVERLVENAKNAKMGQQRNFHNCGHLYDDSDAASAMRLPIMVLLCASEGGMQRAVMRSYEWKTQTLYKESVIRMEAQVLERRRSI